MKFSKWNTENPKPKRVLIPVPQTEAMRNQLAPIPLGKRADIIRQCVALQFGTPQEQAIAKAEIDLIRMKI